MRRSHGGPSQPVRSQEPTAAVDRGGWLGAAAVPPAFTPRQGERAVQLPELRNAS
jgi:hypothetical protein